ncbi:MAG: adenylate kinase [Cyanobacteria bacterium SIG29]|nr:adenylate kinase [Cyanobacteria bacterium SIG29]
MFISKISSGFSVNNYRNNVSFQRRGMLSPLKADTFSFSGKVQEKSNEPQLKEKTIYIFLGPPASGKGTQAEKLAKKLNIAHISTGDLLREEVKNETKLGLEAREYMNSGRLVPTELFERILVDRISQKDCQKGYILDGFPRTEEQARMIDELNSEENAKIKVIQLVVDEDKLIERMTARAKYQNREDDTVDKLRTRIVVYNGVKDTLVNYYGDKVVPIDANLDISAVQSQINESIEEDLA